MLPSSLVNASFEIPGLGSSYRYNPSATGIGWTFSTQSGIQGNNSAWGAPPAPNGTQSAFIQSTGSISQALSLAAGNYTLLFQAAQRACCVSPYVQTVRVTVDGTSIGNLLTPTGSGFKGFIIPFSVATSGAHTIMFAGTDPNDRTVFIDAVSLITGTGSLTALVGSPNPTKVQRNVMFTASVTGLNPTGTVAFTSNGTTMGGCGSVALTGSGNTRTATCTTTFAAQATYAIVATYSGDSSNAASVSALLSEVVVKRR